MEYIKAKSISYGGKRSRLSVDAIVFHYTGNKGDTAAGNASFFARSGDGNTRPAGAHIFIDQKGEAVKSIALNLIAWSVGDWEGTANGGGSLHGTYRNANTVSIELCDIATKDPSKAMIKAVKKVIKYIRKACPNAKVVCRHWDITGKSCPGRMTGLGNEKWIKFLKDIGELENTRPSVVPYPTVNLKQGMENEQVGRLQRCMNKIDHAGLKVDKSYGPKTAKAVYIFKQKHMGVKHPNGKVVGKKCRAKIKELMK